MKTRGSKPTSVKMWGVFAVNNIRYRMRRWSLQEVRSYKRWAIESRDEFRKNDTMGYEFQVRPVTVSWEEKGSRPLSKPRYRYYRIPATKTMRAHLGRRKRQ